MDNVRYVELRTYLNEQTGELVVISLNGLGEIARIPAELVEQFRTPE